MEIDDDTFEYTGGFSQCIGGFGRNAINDICEAFELQDLEGQEEVDGRDKTEYCIGELVRWCRGLNRLAKQRKIVNDALLSACQAALPELSCLTQQVTARVDGSAFRAMEQLKAAIQLATQPE